MAKKQTKPVAEIVAARPRPVRWFYRHTGLNRRQRRHGAWPKPNEARFMIPALFRPKPVNVPYRKEQP